MSVPDPESQSGSHAKVVVCKSSHPSTVFFADVPRVRVVYTVTSLARVVLLYFLIQAEDRGIFIHKLVEEEHQRLHALVHEQQLLAIV